MGGARQYHWRIQPEIKLNFDNIQECEKMHGAKTYGSGDSHVVTQHSTNPPVHSLSSGERTGSSILCDL